MNYVVLVLIGVVLLPIAFTFLFIWLYNKDRAKQSAETQQFITDRDILEMIDTQPDGMLSADLLAEKTPLSKSQAKVRLSLLREFGVLKSHYGRNFKGYFSLFEPIDKRPAPAFSAAPFLTVEDMLILFKHFNFRLTPQQLIMVTGLPVTILQREMKYFQKQKILQSLTEYSYGGTYGNRSFVLMEPYRSQPERFLEQQLDLNRQMEAILKREDLV